MSIHRPSAGEVGLGAMNSTDRRAEVQREAQERALLRQEQLAAQRSPLNTPETRIRLWERLHSLNLPRNRTHTLVRLIAQQTGLTVQDVQDEQRRRAGLAGSAVADSADTHEELR